jgi:hypothetical protein
MNSNIELAICGFLKCNEKGYCTEELKQLIGHTYSQQVWDENVSAVATRHRVPEQEILLTTSNAAFIKFSSKMPILHAPVESISHAFAHTTNQRRRKSIATSMKTWEMLLKLGIPFFQS